MADKKNNKENEAPVEVAVEETAAATSSDVEATEERSARTWAAAPLEVKLRWKLLLSGLLLAGLTVAVASIIVVPIYVRRIAQSLLDDVMTGNVLVGSAGIRSDNALIANNVRVHLDDDQRPEPFLRVQQIIVELTGNPLFGEDVKVTKVRLIQPQIAVRRAPDETYNLQWAFKPRKPSVEKVDEGFNLPPEGIEIRGGTLAFEVESPAGIEYRLVTEQLHADVQEVDQKIEVRNVSGTFFRGELAGWMDISRLSPFAFELDLKIDGADMSQLVLGTDLEGKEIAGELFGQLAILSNSNETDGKALGSGFFEVQNGNLWEFPVMTSLLNVLDLGLPGRAGIQEAEGKFHVTSNSFVFEEMRFEGKPTSVIGSGWVLLDGSRMQFFFYPKLSGGLLSKIPLIGGIVNSVLSLPASELSAVEVTGKFGEPESKWVPLGSFQAFLRTVAPPEDDK